MWRGGFVLLLFCSVTEACSWSPEAVGATILTVVAESQRSWRRQGPLEITWCNVPAWSRVS